MEQLQNSARESAAYSSSLNLSRRRQVQGETIELERAAAGGNLSHHYLLNVTNIPDAVDYETPVVSPDNAASADGPSTVADEPPGIGV